MFSLKGWAGIHEVTTEYASTLERMATEVTVTDLPEEVLVKIFSFLDTKQLPKLFLVCSKFNAAAKHPSLWRRCEFIAGENDSRKISSFCSFFSRYPLIRVLTIIDRRLFFDQPLDYVSVNSFNQLFENLKHLRCLNFEMKLANIVLPSSLQHFTCKLCDDFCKEQFQFLDQCPKIERLHLNAFGSRSLTSGISSTLLKYQLTLSALHLKIDFFEEEWFPLIANCLSLKELGLHYWDVDIANLSKLFETSLSSRLEFLYIQNIDTLQSFNGVEFPELKFLFTESPEEDLMTILSVIKRMPKLHSLHINGQVSFLNAEKFCSLIKICKSLRYLVIRYLVFEFDFNVKDEFESIIRKLNEGSNEGNLWKLSHEYTRSIGIGPSFKCNDWNPNQFSIDQSKQHKQLRLVEYDIMGRNG